MAATSTILMIRPVNFRYNELTAESNHFQTPGKADTDLQSQALAEFSQMAALLRSKGITVIEVADRLSFDTPDSIFPNNWISVHPGQIYLYPMEAENRRRERRADILTLPQLAHPPRTVIDLSAYEKDGKFLEGTGSMVLDRDRKICFACRSSRTHPEVLARFCELSDYQSIVFTASDESGAPIYHTNVMMSVGEQFAVICLASIKDPGERKQVTDALESAGKTLVDISFAQLHAFAGNVLELQSTDGKKLLAMSERAYRSFTTSQRVTLERCAELVHFPLYAIEDAGGGSARCMIAEIF